MKSLALFLAFFQIAFSLSGECNSYEREKLNEGYRTHVYKDSKGIPTIGVGFNLMKSGARQQIAAVGANYDKLLAGTQGLNDKQIRTLFNQDMATAVSCVTSWIGNWSSLSTTRQSAIADMSFNLGCAGIRQFVKFRAAVEHHNFAEAVVQMKSSLWCRQVGVRCDRNVRCMQ